MKDPHTRYIVDNASEPLIIKKYYNNLYNTDTTSRCFSYHDRRCSSVNGRYSTNIGNPQAIAVSPPMINSCKSTIKGQEKRLIADKIVVYSNYAGIY